MYLGVDVGGTHTDGAALAENFEIVRTIKIPTGEVLASLTEVLGRLLAGTDPRRVRRLAVSSTLGLNALLTGQADPVGVLASGGPGLPVADFASGPLYEPLAGLQNHLGEILAPPDPAQARAAAARLRERGARAWAVISKFGPKNPASEEALALAARAEAPDFPLTLASGLSGRLNFPRRLNTAVFNSAVSRLYSRFVRDLTAAAQALGLACPIRLLTADGGALSPEEALVRPALVLAAGPAAGLLGLWSLAGLKGDVLMVDMGGTSTDLAVMADGRPLTTAEGLDIAGWPTLVRSFLTRSLALGGDLGLTVSEGRVDFAGRREGPPLALCPDEVGLRPPTFTDALNGLGLTRLGQVGASRAALARLDETRPPEETAARALDRAMELIGREVRDFLGQVNCRPVYTLGALRLARPVQPEAAAFLGGPAEALARPVAEALGLRPVVPPQAALANAVGAARARPCPAADLYADTAQGLMTIPALGRTKTIGRDYTLARAQAELLDALGEALAGLPEAGPPQVIEAESFNQLTGRGRADRIFRVRAQARPGFLGVREEVCP
jgi:N-methylhydantoinase A/oxoprolinase/acetone carboxylase beta subunit